MRFWFTPALLALALSLVGCDGDGEGERETMPVRSTGNETEVESKHRQITVTPTATVPIEGAALGLELPAQPAEPGEIAFDFMVEGYALGAQTPGFDAIGMANSANGQHIHVLLNNGPYSAHYESTVAKTLEAGHYVILAFLSRSWHESIKTPGAHVAMQLGVGDGQHDQVDLEQPHLFYSRPKGEYTGAATARVMLDFYLLNADLDEDGYRVEATVNGESFVLTEWRPHIIEGLPMGETTIRLELFDPDGESVASPFNPMERTITLAPGSATD